LAPTALKPPFSSSLDRSSSPSGASPFQRYDLTSNRMRKVFFTLPKTLLFFSSTYGGERPFLSGQAWAAVIQTSFVSFTSVKNRISPLLPSSQASFVHLHCVRSPRTPIFPLCSLPPRPNPAFVSSRNFLPSSFRPLDSSLLFYFTPRFNPGSDRPPPSFCSSSSPRAFAGNTAFRPAPVAPSQRPRRFF